MEGIAVPVTCEVEEYVGRAGVPVTCEAEEFVGWDAVPVTCETGGGVGHLLCTYDQGYKPLLFISLFFHISYLCSVLCSYISHVRKGNGQMKE